MSLRASATLRACSGAMYCGEPRKVPLWVISGLGASASPRGDGLHQAEVQHLHQS